MDLYIRLNKIDKLKDRLQECKKELKNISNRTQNGAAIYTDIQPDSLGESLIPRDFIYTDRLIKVAKTTGNGDCLYNSVSITLIGKY